MSTSTPASTTYTPSLHVQSDTIEPIEVEPPQAERIAEAGTATSSDLESALIDVLDTLKSVRTALQAAGRLDYEHEAEEASAVRRAADAALRHASTRTSAALDASRAADTQLADVLEAAGWPNRTLHERRRAGLPF